MTPRDAGSEGDRCLINLKKTERWSGWVEWVRLVIVPLVLPELEGFSHSAASTCKLTIINISLTRPTDQTRRVGGTLPHLCQWLHLIHAYRTPSWCIWAHVVLTLRRSVYHWSPSVPFKCFFSTRSITWQTEHQPMLKQQKLQLLQRSLDFKTKSKTIGCCDDGRKGVLTTSSLRDCVNHCRTVTTT